MIWPCSSCLMETTTYRKFGGCLSTAVSGLTPRSRRESTGEFFCPMVPCFVCHRSLYLFSDSPSPCCGARKVESNALVSVVKSPRRDLGACSSFLRLSKEQTTLIAVGRHVLEMVAHEERFYAVGWCGRIVVECHCHSCRWPSVRVLLGA